MSEAARRERFALELLATRRGWDRPPALGLVYELADGKLHPVAIPIGGDVWSNAHVTEVVQVIGHALVIDTEGADLRMPHLHMVAPLDLGRFAGCWLVVETWQAPPAHADEIRRRADAGGSIPRFADLPGAIEAKQALVTDPGGGIVVAHHERGGDVDTATEATGPVPDVLREMTARLAEQIARAEANR